MSTGQSDQLLLHTTREKQKNYKLQIPLPPLFVTVVPSYFAFFLSPFLCPPFLVSFPQVITKNILIISICLLLFCTVFMCVRFYCAPFDLFFDCCIFSGAIFISQYPASYLSQFGSIAGQCKMQIFRNLWWWQIISEKLHVFSNSTELFCP